MGSRPRPSPEGEGGDEIVLVCIVVRKGNVCIDLTWNVCVFSGNCFGEGQVWSFLSILFFTRATSSDDESRLSRFSSGVRALGSLSWIAERRSSLGICWILSGRFAQGQRCVGSMSRWACQALDSNGGRLMVYSGREQSSHAASSRRCSRASLK